MKKTECDTITDSDKQLLESINSGSSDGFSELVREYEGKLYNFGLKVCKNVTDAEDLVQETFFNVFKSVEGFRNDTKLKHWVYKIAANVCWRMRRKSKYAPETELSFDAFLSGDHFLIEKKLPVWASQPVDQLLNRELSERIKTAVDSLPETYKCVLVLRDIEGVNTAGVSDILSITQQTVKVRLHRARLFLREELKGYYDKKEPIV